MLAARDLMKKISKRTRITKFTPLLSYWRNLSNKKYEAVTYGSLKDEKFEFSPQMYKIYNDKLVLQTIKW